MERRRRVGMTKGDGDGGAQALSPPASQPKPSRLPGKHTCLHEFARRGGCAVLLVARVQAGVMTALPLRVGTRAHPHRCALASRPSGSREANGVGGMPSALVPRSPT